MSDHLGEQAATLGVEAARVVYAGKMQGAFPLKVVAIERWWRCWTAPAYAQDPSIILCRSFNEKPWENEQEAAQQKATRNR